MVSAFAKSAILCRPALLAERMFVATSTLTLALLAVACSNGSTNVEQHTRATTVSDCPPWPTPTSTDCTCDVAYVCTAGQTCWRPYSGDSMCLTPPCSPSCAGKCGGSDGCSGTCQNNCQPSQTCGSDNVCSPP